MYRIPEVELLGLICKKAEWLNKKGLGRVQDNEVVLDPTDEWKIHLTISHLAAENKVTPEEIKFIYEEMACDAIQVGNLTAMEVVNGILKGEILFYQINKKDLIEGIYSSNRKFGVLFNMIDEEAIVKYIREHLLCDTEIYASHSIDYMMMFDFEKYAMKRKHQRFYFHGGVLLSI